jgi:hypothetical protein
MKHIHNFQVESATCEIHVQAATLRFVTAGQEHYAFVMPREALVQLVAQMQHGIAQTPPEQR